MGTTTEKRCPALIISADRTELYLYAKVVTRVLLVMAGVVATVAMRVDARFTRNVQRGRSVVVLKGSLKTSLLCSVAALPTATFC